MKITLACLAIVFYSCRLFSQDHSVLLEKEKQMFDIVCSGDKAGAEKLFAADYTTINADGIQQNREETMRDFGKFKGSTYALSNQQLRSYGNMAIITGKAKFYVKSIPVAYVLYTEIWTTVNGEWKFSGWQGTMTGMPSWYPVIVTVIGLLLAWFIIRAISRKMKKRLV